MEHDVQHDDAPHDPPEDDDQPTTLLLVEDETMLRRILREGLREQGYIVETAPTADAAWVKIRNGLNFDVLVTDIRMPGRMDGLDLARLVRSERQDVRIIIMSGFASGSITVEHRATFLSKPFTPTKLAAVISE